LKIFIHHNNVTRCAIFSLNFSKKHSAAGLRSDSLGELKRSHRPPSRNMERTSKGREGRGGREEEGGKEVERDGGMGGKEKGKEGRGREGRGLEPPHTCLVTGLG